MQLSMHISNLNELVNTFVQKLFCLLWRIRQYGMKNTLKKMFMTLRAYEFIFAHLMCISAELRLQGTLSRYHVYVCSFVCQTWRTGKIGNPPRSSLETVCRGERKMRVQSSNYMMFVQRNAADFEIGIFLSIIPMNLKWLETSRSSKTHIISVYSGRGNGLFYKILVCFGFLSEVSWLGLACSPKACHFFPSHA